MTPTTDLLRPAVFLDRDGTLIEDIDYLGNPRQIERPSGVIDPLVES